MLKEDEIQAMLRLLDDPDEQIYLHIKTKLCDYGPEVIPLLENAWENFSYGVVFQNRIEEIIHNIQFEHLKHHLTEWKNKHSDNLLEGMLWINRYQYPDIDIHKIQQFIELLKRDVWLELNDQLTALEKIKVINHILFSVHNFTGNTTNYHAPQNSYLSDVIETKKGTPVSLSILYMIIAQSLNIPVYGINLPRHFIIAYIDPFSDDKNKVLFYVNPFNKGSVLNKRDIDYFLKQLKIEAHTKYYNPCSNNSIIKRVLNNLSYSYEKLGYLNKVEEIQKLLEIFIDVNDADDTPKEEE